MGRDERSEAEVEAFVVEKSSKTRALPGSGRERKFAFREGRLVRAKKERRGSKSPTRMESL